MKLDILCVIFLGYYLHATFGQKNKNVQNNVRIPELIQKHSHYHTIYKPPTQYSHHEYNNYNDDKNGHLEINDPHYNPEKEIEDKYGYNPENKQKTKHKKAGKKKNKKQKKKKYGDDKDFKKILDNYDKKPEEDDDVNGGFTKSVHTEHYELKKINPNARFPDEKYIIEGSYKVHETDPWGHPTTSFEKYNSPLEKISASIISNYDYVNFKPGEYSNEKEEEPDHDNLEYNGKVNYNYGDDNKKSQGYHGSSNHGPTEDIHDYTSHYDAPYHQQKKSYDHPAAYKNNDQGGKIVQYTFDTPKSNSNGKDYEKSAGYEDFLHGNHEHSSSPYSAPVQQNYETPHTKPVNQKNKKQKIQVFIVQDPYASFKTDSIKPVAHLQKTPAETEFIVSHDNDSVQRELEYEFEKEFGHLVEPGHSSASHNYDNDYEKHLFDYIYG